MSIATYLSHAVDALRLPLAVVDERGTLLFASQQLAQALSFESPPALRRELFWPGFGEVLERWRADNADETAAGRLGEAAGTFFDSAGAEIPVRLLIADLGDSVYAVHVIAGLSQRGAQSDPLHAQRLELLGMLAGGVAHDFNNILAGMLGHVTYLKMILPPQGPHAESLAAIEDGGRKASGMTQQILNFSRVHSGDDVTRVDVGSLVQKTCSLVRAAISPDFSLQASVPTQSCVAVACEGKLAQVLVNLIMNARDASQPGSTITVEVKEISDPTVLVGAFGSTELPASRYASIAVADQGHGIPPEILKRVFEPYFSTKRGKGTGLGLSTVSAIVRECGGAITLRSRVNEGTTVEVFIPVVAGEVGSIREQARPHLFGGRERILVVDDETPVRNVLCLSLQHLGYQVEVASSGREGVDKYVRDRDGFDLVILDMLMPQLSGSEVFFELKEYDPQVKVLLVSGFSSESAVENIIAHGGLGFLQKPFTIEELSARVRSCLDQSSETKP